jgi:hypothetical protein
MYGHPCSPAFSLHTWHACNHSFTYLSPNFHHFLWQCSWALRHCLLGLVQRYINCLALLQFSKAISNIYVSEISTVSDQPQWQKYLKWSFLIWHWEGWSSGKILANLVAIKGSNLNYPVLLSASHKQHGLHNASFIPNISDFLFWLHR